MYQRRRAGRPTSRSTVRRATRSAIRTRWRAPDDLGTALTCFRRAICTHRRLVRLAPSFFDSALIESERREQEARRHWLDAAAAALRKVYGAAPDPHPPVPDRPPLPPPRTRLAVERELASCCAWLTIGGDALRRFQVRAPHAWVSFSRLVRLIETATALARLATGADSAQPQTEPSIYATAWADLERIYGDHAQEPAGSTEVPSHFSLK
jgi:hypothetical protein